MGNVVKFHYAKQIASLVLRRFMLLFLCISLVGCGRSLQDRVKANTIAATRGDAVAQHNLGVMYMHGLGVNQSFPEALKWFHKAAPKGMLVHRLI